MTINTDDLIQLFRTIRYNIEQKDYVEADGLCTQAIRNLLHGTEPRVEKGEQDENKRN